MLGSVFVHITFRTRIRDAFAFRSAALVVIRVDTLLVIAEDVLSTITVNITLITSHVGANAFSVAAHVSVKQMAACDICAWDLCCIELANVTCLWSICVASSHGAATIFLVRLNASPARAIVKVIPMPRLLLDVAMRASEGGALATLGTANVNVGTSAVLVRTANEFSISPEHVVFTTLRIAGAASQRDAAYCLIVISTISTRTA